MQGHLWSFLTIKKNSIKTCIYHVHLKRLYQIRHFEKPGNIYNVGDIVEQLQSWVVRVCYYYYQHCTSSDSSPVCSLSAYTLMEPPLYCKSGRHERPLVGDCLNYLGEGGARFPLKKSDRKKIACAGGRHHIVSSSLFIA